VLKVGPRSAAAEPGPACYGRGGQEPTVTDAYVQSGLIAPDEFLGGELRLDPSLAERALAELGQRLGLSATETAAGILRVATANMYAQFLPLMAQHGVDHRRFSLLAYGGAGPTHAFLLAREVGIGSVIVPPSPGTLCALGCLLADLRADFVRTVYRQLDDAVADDLADDLARLEQQAEAWLVAEGVAPEARSLVRSAEMRYHGQSFEVTVRLNRSGATGLRELPELFHERHRAVYGYAEPGAAVELITMRVQGVGAAPRPARLAPRGQREARQNGPPIPAARRTIVLDGVPVEAGVYRRDELRPGARIDGPAVVIQYDSTTVVPPDFVVEVDEWLNLIGTREGAGDSRGESR
jgi:N-methylhydantoinase A